MNENFINFFDVLVEILQRFNILSFRFLFDFSEMFFGDCLVNQPRRERVSR